MLALAAVGASTAFVCGKFAQTPPWVWCAASWQPPPQEDDDAGAAAARGPRVSTMLRQAAAGVPYGVVDASYRTNTPGAAATVRHVDGVSGRLYHEDEFWRRMTRCVDAPYSKRSTAAAPSMAATSEFESPVFARAWFVCRDEHGAYRMTVHADTAAAIEAVERAAETKAAAAMLAARDARLAAEKLAEQAAKERLVRAAQCVEYDRELHDFSWRPPEYALPLRRKPLPLPPCATIAACATQPRCRHNRCAACARRHRCCGL